MFFMELSASAITNVLQKSPTDLSMVKHHIIHQLQLFLFLWATHCEDLSSFPSLDWLWCRLTEKIIPVFPLTSNLEWYPMLEFLFPWSHVFLFFSLLPHFMLSEKGRLGSNSFYMCVNVIILRFYFISGLAKYIVLVRNFPSA